MLLLLQFTCRFHGYDRPMNHAFADIYAMQCRLHWRWHHHDLSSVIGGIILVLTVMSHSISDAPALVTNSHSVQYGNVLFRQQQRLGVD
jgi:hypothetical protein